MRKTVVSLLLCLVMLCALLPTPAAQADSSVKVTIPSFPVTISSQLIGKEDEYPFLYYQEITYLPLTYYGCRAMGLMSRWTQETGLVITDVGNIGTYQATKPVSSNSGTLYATLATGKINLNGTQIDNSTEEYPFLVFRDVTYLPMTWRNMHTLLGCDYSFDATNGLSISRAETNAVNLSLERNSLDGASIVAWQGYFWYLDNDGYISRTPVSGGQAEQLFEQEKDSVTGNPAWPTWTICNEQLYLTYVSSASLHSPQGQASLFQISKDGSATRVHNAALPLLQDADLTLSIEPSYGDQRRGNNLLCRGAGDYSWYRVGDEAYHYGTYFWADGKGDRSTGSARRIYRIGDDVYVLGCKDAERYTVPDVDLPAVCSTVCRVNLKTGETTQLTDWARDFEISGDTLWYVRSGSIEKPSGLFSLPLAGGTQVGHSQEGQTVTELWVAPDAVYYHGYKDVVLAQNGALYAADQTEPLTDREFTQAWFDGETLIVQLQGGDLIAFQGGKEIQRLTGVEALCAAMSGTELKYVAK